MAKTKLHSNKEFLVGEEKILNYILGVLFLALFLYGVIDAVLRHFKNIDYQSFIFVFALIPAFLFFRKGSSPVVYIRINRNGIYFQQELVTDWALLQNAYIDQKEKKGIINLQDNFQLVLEYKREGDQKLFRRKIPLTNTQNKSEEEVLEAVIFFWKHFKLGNL